MAVAEGLGRSNMPGAAQPTSASRRGRILWWDAKTDPKDADLIELADGATREGIDFTLP